MLALMLMSLEPADAEVLTTSCYGEELRGSLTASGELFDPDAFTAAHPGYQFGTVLAVASLDTGATVYVTVNPARRLRRQGPRKKGAWPR